MIEMSSLPRGYRAVVLGASGAIGAAFMAHLQADPRCGMVTGYSRRARPVLDLMEPHSLADVIDDAAGGGPLHLLLIATGALKTATATPEKSLKQLQLASMAELYAVNAAGPMAALTAFLPLMPRTERGLIGVLSAKVGSIADNRLGGWHSYRMSKAALNMGIKGAAIELARTHKQLVAVSLHPGTVASKLSAPFSGTRQVLLPEASAGQLLRVLDGIKPHQSGSLVSYTGDILPF